MKHLLLTTIAAVVLVGCGESQQSAPVAGHQSYPVSEVDSGLLDAAENGNLEAVEKHLAAGMDFELKCAGCGGTALLHAAFGGHKEIVELLIAKGADVNAKNDSGRTSLNWADKEIADLLRKHGGKTGEELDISIHDAAYEGNIEAVKQHIADGADVNAKGKYGWAPLHYASDGEGKKNVVELLIANDADVNAKDDDGSTPLHVAAYNGHKEIVVLLIDASANVNAQDVLGSNKGNTPLNAASEENHPEIADLLRKHGGKTGEELKAAGK